MGEGPLSIGSGDVVLLPGPPLQNQGNHGEFSLGLLDQLLNLTTPNFPRTKEEENCGGAGAIKKKKDSVRFNL